MDIHGHPWRSMEVHGLPWISMEVHGSPWTSMEVHGGPWRSMEVHGYPWKSMDIHEIHGNPWKSVEIRGKFQQALKRAENREKQLLCFLPFYPLRSAFQAYSCSPERRTFRDLSIGIKMFSFHAIWLGIEPFLCFSIDVRWILDRS